LEDDEGMGTGDGMESGMGTKEEYSLGEDLVEVLALVCLMVDA
jgi:hypothetical protein